MRLPGEEEALRHTPGPVRLDRRGSIRRTSVAPAGLDAPLELTPAAPASRPRPRRLVPVGRPAADAFVERARILARRAGERFQRTPDPASLLAEGARHEAEGRLPAAFRSYAAALLAAPLDATPVRPLERLAAAQGCRIALAQLYERVLEKVPDHPSAETLRQRTAHLRTLAVTTRGLPEAAATESGAVPPPPPSDAEGPARQTASGASSHQRARTVALHEAPAPIDAGAPAPRAEQPGTVSSREATPLIAGPSAPATGAAETFALREGMTTQVAGHAAPHAAEIGRDIEAPSPRTVPLGTRWLPEREVPAHARLLAWAIDGTVLALVPLASVAAGLSVFEGGYGLSGLDRLLHLLVHGGALPTAAFALAVLVAFVYLTLGAALGGRTLGARVAGLRAVDRASGLPPDIATAALRSVLAIAGTLAFLAGPLWAFVDPRGQSLHDRVAGTCMLSVRGAR